MKDSPKTDLTARLEDMCELAGKRGRPVFSLFFNDREQYDAMTFLKGRNDVFPVFWGGNSACSRKMLRLSDRAPDNESFDDFPIYPLTLSFRKADKPGHRDFLGAFMGLGIKRETVGDIFVGEGAAAVFCTKTARDMISDGITAVGRIGVSVSDGISDAAGAAIVPAGFSDLTVNTSSMRTDCVVSAITGLSREKSAAFIRSGSVMLNYEECLNVSRNVSEGDILTLRGYGKLVVGGSGATRKGRIRLDLKKYI